MSTKITDFFVLLYHNLTIYTNRTKCLATTNVEFNGLSSPSAIYRNVILQSPLKILAKIQLSVICTHMFDFRKPGYITTLPSNDPQTVNIFFIYSS